MGHDQYKHDIVYFELNNWFSGRDYPEEEPFLTWMSNDLDLYFENEEWVKENKLCVVAEYIDMSVNFCVTATREWVKANCPKLLDLDAEYTYQIQSQSKDRVWTETFNKRYSDFLRCIDEDEIVRGLNSGTAFLPYKEENIGVHWIEEELA